MNVGCWCRLCKKWVYEHHFGTFRNECGQSRDKAHIRYHSGNPLCGDVWLLKDGRYLVVDYKESFTTGLTFSDGNKLLSRVGYNYTDGFANFLRYQEAKLISVFEELPYPRGIDSRGWTDSKYIPDSADYDGSRSVDFLKSVLRTK